MYPYLIIYLYWSQGCWWGYRQNPDSTTTQPQPQPNNLSWIRHENEFAFHPTHPPQKLNVNNISAVTDPILMRF